VRSLLLAFAAALLALPAVAQVEVMEPGGYPSPRQKPSYSRDEAEPRDAQSGEAELYNQVLQLQDEVMKLNGIVEEQAEQIRQLKQQRLDDYISLDKRLTALGAGASPPPAGTQSPPGAGAGTYGLTPAEQGTSAPIRADVAPRAPVATAPAAGEQPAYQAAFDLLKTKQYPEAEAAFKAFLDQYPTGTLAGNAHFWLGEFYAVVNGDNAAAKPHYEALVYQYPGSTKMPDALFKLGRIYMQEGDAQRGRELLQRVQDEYPSAESAPKAQAYLQQNP
jgi:tol-pal system protein YbgF